MNTCKTIYGKAIQEYDSYFSDWHVIFRHEVKKPILVWNIFWLERKQLLRLFFSAFDSDEALKSFFIQRVVLKVPEKTFR